MIGSMVDSLIGSASQKRVHSKSQNWDRSKYRFWEYYRFWNNTNIGYIPNLHSSGGISAPSFRSIRKRAIFLTWLRRLLIPEH